MEVQDLPEKIRTRIEPILDPGEQIEWIDLPSRFFSKAYVLLSLLVGLPISVTAIYLYIRVQSTNSWLTPFVYILGLFGFAILQLPLTLVWRRRNAVYVITNQKAIILERGILKKTHLFPPERLVTLYRRQERTGSGDLVLERREYNNDDCTRSLDFALKDIEHVDQVEKMVRKLAGLDFPSVTPGSWEAKLQELNPSGWNRIPTQQREKIQKELEPDETVLWIDTPKQYVRDGVTGYRTVYAITNRRVLIADFTAVTTYWSHPLGKLFYVFIRPKWEDNVDVILIHALREQDPRMGWGFYEHHEIAFQGIDHAEEIMNILNEARMSSGCLA